MNCSENNILKRAQLVFFLAFSHNSANYAVLYHLKSYKKKVKLTAEN